jgi:hypothetical protein
MEGSKPVSATKLQPKSGFKRFLWRLFFIILVVGGIIFYWHFYFIYSVGDRDGVLVKFSLKGNIFKTYEGEIVRSVNVIQTGSGNTNNFFFSVIDKKLADSLGKVAGKNVNLHYHQYLGTLPWRGDYYNGQNTENGQYIVDSIITVSPIINTGL